MSIPAFNVFNKGYLIACIVATFGFTVYCFYEYSRNEDASSITFKKYHEDRNNIYPAITLCFSEYLDPEQFQNNETLMEDYRQFLKGTRWSEQLASLDYEQATLNISKYLYHTYITKFEAEDKDEKNIGAPTYSVSQGVDPYYKCWTFEVPFMENERIMKLGIQLKKSIFPNSQRSTKGAFKVAISYPGQTIRARVIKFNWKHINYTEYTMEFGIQNMVVLKKRSMSGNKCHEEPTKDDINQLLDLIRLKGCRPPFLKLDSSYPPCGSQRKNSTKEEIKNDLNINYQEPCQQVEKILYLYDEYEKMITKDRSVFEILINFQGETYMEIEQHRAYDFQSLFGNAGGYIGVFLGVTFLQLPSFLLSVSNFVKKMF